jgi:hypothetical protein
MKSVSSVTGLFEGKPSRIGEILKVGYDPARQLSASVFRYV